VIVLRPSPNETPFEFENTTPEFQPSPAFCACADAVLHGDRLALIPNEMPFEFESTAVRTYQRRTGAEAKPRARTS